jgi:hypothetical protein
MLNLAKCQHKDKAFASFTIKISEKDITNNGFAVYNYSGSTMAEGVRVEYD